MSFTGNTKQLGGCTRLSVGIRERVDCDEEMYEVVEDTESSNNCNGRNGPVDLSDAVRGERNFHGDGDVTGFDDNLEEGEDVEDIWGGEDPSEVEVEKFCLPSESTILEDLNIHLKKKKLVIYPMKLMDLAHPTMIDCIEKCSDFKTTYLQNQDTKCGSSWKGLIELTFKTSFYAMEAIDVIRNIRDDVIVKHYETDEPAMRKTLERWLIDEATVCSSVPKSVRNMLVVRRIKEDVRSSQLRPLFPSSLDIVVSKESLRSQSSDWNPGKSAFVFFKSEEDLKAAVEKYSEEGIVVNGNKLKLIPYQPPNFPCGLIKMKRRYRILRQIQELDKTINEQRTILNEASRSKIKTSLEQCKLTIEKDNKARQELGLPLHRLGYLHRIPAIRESVPLDFDWLPQISFRTDDGEDRHQGRRDNKKRNKRGRRGSGGWVDNTQRRKDPPPRPSTCVQIARVHEIAAKIAQIASSMGAKAEQNPADNNKEKEFINIKGLRSPEVQNNHPPDGPFIKVTKCEEVSQDQSSRDIKPLMSVQDMSWNNRPLQRFENPNTPKGGSNINNPTQGYAQGMSQVPVYDTFNQAIYDQFPQQGPPPPGNYYNYAPNYDTRHPYAGYGYQPSVPNVWGANQNQPWNPQQNNYLWQNQP